MLSLKEVRKMRYKLNPKVGNPINILDGQVASRQPSYLIIVGGKMIT